MTIYLDVQLPAHSSDYGERDGQPLNAPISILLRVGFTWHTALPRYRWALTPPFHPYRITTVRAMRRFISVALSLKSPSPGVTRHPVLRSSDFPRGQMPARSLVLLNNSIIMQTQCCVKNKMSFYSSKAFLWYHIYNTKAYTVRIRPQFSHSTMLVFPATLLTTADGSII